jgi:hypothetical protein
MYPTLLKALLGLVLVLALASGAAIHFLRDRRSLAAVLQLIGAAFLVLVVLTHVCEALNLFPAMRWGADDSVGHFVDLGCAVLGVTLFAGGYLLHVCTHSSAK